MTACRTVGLIELRILGEKITTYIHIQTSLAGREKSLSPLKVTVISGNPTDLVMKSMGLEARETSLSGILSAQS